MYMYVFYCKLYVCIYKILGEGRLAAHIPRNPRLTQVHSQE